MKTLKILLLSSLVLNVYLINQKERPQEKPEVVTVAEKTSCPEVLPDKSVPKTALTKDTIKTNTSSLKRNNLQDIDSPIIHTEAEEIAVNDAFANAEKEWRIKLEDYMKNQLRLSDSEYQIYENLKEEFMVESSDIFAAPEETKEGEVFIPTHEQNLKYSLVRDKYFKMLERELGHNTFSQLMEFVDNTNKEAARKLDERPFIHAVTLF